MKIHQKPSYHDQISEVPPPAETIIINNTHDFAIASLSHSQRLDIHIPKIGEGPHPGVPVQHSIRLENKLILDLLEGEEQPNEMFETPKNVARILEFLDKKVVNQELGHE